jgi:hypothetical protein
MGVRGFPQPQQHQSTQSVFASCGKSRYETQTGHADQAACPVLP